MATRGIDRHRVVGKSHRRAKASLLIPKNRLRWQLLDKFCSVRSAVDRQVSFLIGDSETRFPGTAL